MASAIDAEILRGRLLIHCEARLDAVAVIARWTATAVRRAASKEALIPGGCGACAKCC